MIVLQIIAILCYLFAVLELILFYGFDIDLTGFAYSPVIAIIIGSILQSIAKKNNKEEDQEQQ